MINLNKEVIKKLKDIDAKADDILDNATHTAEELITSAKLESPSEIKLSREIRDRKKAEVFDSEKKKFEEEKNILLEKSLNKVKSEESKVEKKIDSAADIAVKIFINVIEFKNKENIKDH